MADTSHHLVTAVIPKVPVRQWVLSLPMALRFLLASNPELLGLVLAVLHRVISGYVRKKALAKGVKTKTGAISLIQRFGGSLNLNIHFHCLVLDGVYRQGESSDTLEFQAISSPSAEELTILLKRVVKRIVKLLVRRGVLVAEQEEVYIQELGDDTALPHLQAASVHYRIVLAESAQQGV